MYKNTRCEHSTEDGCIAQKMHAQIEDARDACIAQDKHASTRDVCTTQKMRAHAEDACTQHSTREIMREMLFAQHRRCVHSTEDASTAQEMRAQHRR